MKITLTLFVLFLIFYSIIIPLPYAKAQTSFKNESSVGLSYSFMGSDSELPFFFYANRDGLIKPGARYQSIANIWAHDLLIDNSEGVSLIAGAEAVSRFGNTGNTFHFLQLYASAKYRSFRLSAGRFFDKRGIYMHSLTMGSMTLSRNATPIPKIKLETIDYTDIPFTDGHFQFHLTWSDGMMEEKRYVESPYLHQKSLHIKLNIWRLEMIGGIDHNVIWGGENENLDTRPPQSFRDYLRIVFSQSGSPETAARPAEVINRLGNTIASYDFGVNYRTEGFVIRTYRTFFIEDRPAQRFRSPWDGVWGVGFERNDKNQHLNSILYEHMNTIRQDAKGFVPKGRANYYNHSFYRTGWSYFGSVLGNPLIKFDRSIETGLQPVINNQVIAHHFGLTGTLTSSFTYILFANYSRNYGVCNDRVEFGNCSQFSLNEPPPENVVVLTRSSFRADRTSLFLGVNYEFRAQKGVSVHGAIAMDRGAFSGQLNGLILGISWQH